ncbi:MAG: response regulator transcription factor [Chloroflexi bacterium]|nr:response regulator transcription factor [Chloroflexota bacterium]
MSQSIRVLIADDHPFFRQGIRAALESAADITVVGEAGSGAEVLELVKELRPTVVLMDLQMPRMNGIEATRQLLAEQSGVGVIVVTMFEDDESVFAAMRAGARGYVLKGADRDEILRAIHAVASGEAIFGPAIAQRLMNFFGAGSPRTTTILPELTDREREILSLVAQSRGNAEIGEILSLSPKTVRNHVSNILTKLQVADRTEAALRAREAGL